MRDSTFSKYEASPMSSHLSKQFDLELESIRTRILQMGGLVERQLMAAIDAFSTGNIEAMQESSAPT
jgi:phosphate transport system protein